MPTWSTNNPVKLGSSKANPILFNNLKATVAPAVTDNASKGYQIGSFWVDRVGKTAYQLVSFDGTDAEWLPISGAGTISADEVIYDNTDSPLRATNVEIALNELSWKSISTSVEVSPAISMTVYYVDTTAGDVPIKLPDIIAGNEDRHYRIIKDKGDNDVIVTTVGGIQLVGGEIAQIITQAKTGISFQAHSAEPDYEITQDSRAKVPLTAIAFYGLTEASGILTYLAFSNSTDDPRYSPTTIEVSTGTISGTGILLNVFIGDAGAIRGVIPEATVTNIGTLKRSSGTGTAQFYVEYYHRTAGGVETLLATSNNTVNIESPTYEQYSMAAVIPETVFTATDYFVKKVYVNRTGGGSNPVYSIQYEGPNPAHTIVPVPPGSIAHNTLAGRGADDAHPSEAISYDNATSGLTATDVKDAIDEVVAGLPITTLGTSGTQTIDRSVSDKFVIPSTTGAITLVLTDFTDLQKAELEIIDPNDNVVFPAEWVWQSNIPIQPEEGVILIKIQSVDSNIFATSLGIQSVFSPNDLSPRAWLDADNIAGVDGDAVSSWLDDSGNLNTAVQATPVDRPVLKKTTNGINGKNVVRFDGVAQFMQFPSAVLGWPFTVFVVHRAIAFPADGTAGALLSCDDGAATGRGSIGIQNTGGSVTFESYSRFGTPGGLRSASALSLNTAYCGTVSKNTDSVTKLYLNEDSGAVSGSQTLYPTVNPTIGKKYNTPEQAFNGDIATILIYDSILSDEDRAKVNQFLSLKYNIAFA